MYECINLSHLCIVGKIPENIGSLLELTALTITHNQLSGEFLPFMCIHYFVLVSVCLDWMTVSRLTFRALILTTYCVCLVILGEIPFSIGNLTALITVHLSSNQLTGTASFPNSLLLTKQE